MTPDCKRFNLLPCRLLKVYYFMVHYMVWNGLIVMTGILFFHYLSCRIQEKISFRVHDLQSLEVQFKKMQAVSNQRKQQDASTQKKMHFLTITRKNGLRKLLIQRSLNVIFSAVDQHLYLHSIRVEDAVIRVKGASQSQKVLFQFIEKIRKNNAISNIYLENINTTDGKFKIVFEIKIFLRKLHDSSHMV
jgi:beta-galactosidase/beta-glucuronidase